MASVQLRMCSRFDANVLLCPRLVEAVTSKQAMIHSWRQAPPKPSQWLENAIRPHCCHAIICKNHHPVRMFISQRKTVPTPQHNRPCNCTDCFKIPPDCFGQGHPTAATVLRSMARSLAKPAICSRKFQQVSCNQAWNPPGAWQVWASPPWRWRQRLAG